MVVKVVKTGCKVVKFSPFAGILTGITSTRATGFPPHHSHRMPKDRYCERGYAMRTARPRKAHIFRSEKSFLCRPLCGRVLPESLKSGQNGHLKKERLQQ